MIPKIENALDAVRLGVSKVVITQADALLDGGTTIHL
jgi:acetylglutamate kinase